MGIFEDSTYIQYVVLHTLGHSDIIGVMEDSYSSLGSK